MKEKNSTSGGVGMGGLLQVAFIVLKLCGIIDWSWWWVLAPTWVSFAIIVLICILYIVRILIKS